MLMIGENEVYPPKLKGCERLFVLWQDQPNISVHIDFSLITYEIYLESTRHLDKTQHGYIISALMQNSL